MSATPFEKYLTAEQAEAALGDLGIEIGFRTLQDRARIKRIPGRKINGRWRFRLSELVRWFETHSELSVSPDELA